MMFEVRQAIFRALVVLAAMLCTSTLSAQDHQKADPSHADIVAAYVDAYNAKDLDAMMALMHDEVQWLSVEGDSVEVFANGKADLAAQMKGYISSPASTTSEIDASLTDGRFVAVREIARWTGKDGTERSQSALAIYEIEGGLVRRVWYYPASR